MYRAFRELSLDGFVIHCISLKLLQSRWFYKRVKSFLWKAIFFERALRTHYDIFSLIFSPSMRHCKTKLQEENHHERYRTRGSITPSKTPQLRMKRKSHTELCRGKWLKHPRVQDTLAGSQGDLCWVREMARKSCGAVRHQRTESLE